VPSVADVPDEPLVADVPLVPAVALVPDDPLVADEPLVPALPLLPEVPLEPLVADVPDVPEVALVPDDPLEPDDPLDPDEKLVAVTIPSFATRTPLSPLTFKSPEKRPCIAILNVFKTCFIFQIST
jgi:thrombospondin-related uncharacterized protein